MVPLNFIHVNTGQTLNEISNFGGGVNQIVALFVLSFLALIPNLIGKKEDEEDEGDDEDQGECKEQAEKAENRKKIKNN